MTDLTYEELPIDIGGKPLTYKLAITPPAELGDQGIDLNQESEKLNRQIDLYCVYLAEAPRVRPEVARHLFSRLLDVRRKIIKYSDQSTEDRVILLSEANFHIHRVHADIAREQEFLRQKRELSRSVRVVGVIYMIIIIVLILLGSIADSGMTVMPVIGVPLPVVLWSAVGSLAAILYRFYKHETSNAVQVELELNWLIARPILGIIMGIVSYLMITAGLFIFGSATSVGDQLIKPQLLWVAAFLAGFSDRFWEGIIDKLIGSGARADEPVDRK
jgi:hypothetical protein